MPPVGRKLLDVTETVVAAPVEPDIVGPETLGHPETLAPCELEQHPSLVRIREDMRIPAIGGVTVRVDEASDDLDRLARTGGTLERDSGEVAVVRAALRVRRHVHEFTPGIERDVAHRDAVLVQPAIGQRCGQSLEIGVVHGQVAEGVRSLRDLRQVARELRG